MSQWIIRAAKGRIEKILDMFEEGLRVAAQGCVQAHVGIFRNTGTS
jgi:hypothetical protein